MASFTDRMIGAARLEVRTYEEVEADTSATSQAIGVVLLSSLAGGIGSVGSLSSFLSLSSSSLPNTSRAVDSMWEIDI